MAVLVTQLKGLEGRGDIGVGVVQCTVCVTVELHSNPAPKEIEIQIA
jgi:hypothetical protein